MGQMGQAGNLNNAINMGPGGGVGGVGGGMMGMGMGMGGADQRRPLGDLGMVQDGTRCGDNMVSSEARGNSYSLRLGIAAGTSITNYNHSSILLSDLHESELHRFTSAAELRSLPF